MTPGLTRRVKIVLNFADFTPEELCDITKCKILQQSTGVPLGIEKEFISCFRKIPNSVIAQFNAELCKKNLRNWKNLLVKTLEMESKNSSKKVVSDEVSAKSVGTNTDFVCTC